MAPNDAAVRAAHKPETMRTRYASCSIGTLPLHPGIVSEFRFIPPCSPIRAEVVPTGDGWVHEVKFDGYRVQAHKIGSRVVVFSRNGHDFTDRFPFIAQLLQELPAKAAVLDGEVVASDADGRPNFARLHVRWTWPGTIHLWAFDLLAVNGRDLRLQPLVKRQASLQALLERFGCPAVRPSETFVDGLAMLSAAEEHDLEGVVSKRRDAPYRSVSAGSGARLRRLPGVRRTGSGGGCSSAVSLGAVASFAASLQQRVDAAVWIAASQRGGGGEDRRSRGDNTR
jgi:ATP-dependent DNA ligase